MARILKVAVPALGAVAAAVVVLVGIVLVVSRRIDPVTAAMAGGLALALVELSVAVSHRLQIVPSVGGTWIGRMGVVLGALSGALGLALVMGPGGHATTASVLVGTAAVAALVALVGVQATP